MPSETTKCRECGQRFTPSGVETRCEACRQKRERVLGLIDDAVEKHGQYRVGDIARQTGLNASEITSTLKASHYLVHKVQSNEACAQCGERPAQEGSEYCLACRLALHKALGDAAKTTRERLTGKPAKPEDRLRGMSTTSVLGEKRRRTGSHRFNPAPQHRKGYR